MIRRAVSDSVWIVGRFLVRSRRLTRQRPAAAGIMV